MEEGVGKIPEVESFVGPDYSAYAVDFAGIVLAVVDAVGFVFVRAHAGGGPFGKVFWETYAKL